MKVWLIAAMLAIGAVAAGAQDVPPRPAVDVVWNQAVTVRVAGVTEAVVLDDSVCRVETDGDELRIYGLAVGETVVFVWADGTRSAMVVHVTTPPEPRTPAALSQSGIDAVGRGRVGSSVMANTPGGPTPLVTHEYWDWQQTRDGARLSIRGFSDTYSGEGRRLNLSSLAIQHATPERTISLADFTLDLGATGAQASPLAQYGAFGVRGFDYVTNKGRDRLEVFGGSTIPSHFLSFAGTRYIAGVKFERSVTPEVDLFASGGLVAAPPSGSPNGAREVSPFELTGVSYRVSPAFQVRGAAGVSSRGLMTDAQADYANGRFFTSLGATASAAAFPLNQVQLLTAGESSVRALGGFVWPHVSATTTARHTVSRPGVLEVLRGTSDTVSQNVAFVLPHRQQFSLNMLRNVSSGSVLPSSSNTRLDGSWSSPFGSKVTNSLQLGIGRNRESTDLQSYREWTLRDSASVNLPFGLLMVSFDHERYDPSTASRIRQVVSQLPSSLQDLFRLDPELFLQTVDLPADVRRLLERVQPTTTGLSAAAQIERGRLSLGPTVSVVRDSLTGETSRATLLLGYSATWQLTPSIQLRSALSNQIQYTRASSGFQRANVVTFGIDKTLSGLPGWMRAVAPQYAIEGRVYKDIGIDGRHDPAKPGFAGMTVRLDGGRTTTTDQAGYYRFNKVEPGRHHVSLGTTQFRTAIRVTTPSEVDLEVADRSVRIDFGIVDFARLIGAVFNDYNHDLNRQSDAPGLPGVTVRVAGETFTTTAVTDGSGEFEIDSLPPGDYVVSASAEDLPSGHVLVSSEHRVRVAPIATVIQDVPVRALRSIAGRVLLKDAAGQVQPLRGVRVAAGATTAMTDSEGRYTLRDLPAGLVEIRVVPNRAVPDRLRTPFGVVRLNAAPVTMENANIIVTNTALVEYIAGGID